MLQADQLDLSLLQRLHERFPGDDTSNFDLMDFIYAKGSAFTALWYSRLFWPEFVEIDGMIFFKESMSSREQRQRLAEAVQELGHDRRGIEEAINVVYAAGIFQRHDTTDEEFQWLLERLVEMWASRLRNVYPERHFRVELLDADDWDDVRPVFFQI
jgi:hypothetical protein